MTSTWGGTARSVVVIVLLVAGAVALEAARERWYEIRRPEGTVLAVRSGTLLKKLALSHDALLADAYWVRALQHYGGTRKSSNPRKPYDLLYPFLDLTVTLDPRFERAYRYGAIFLAHPYPDGPGRPDLAITLLEKGMAADPHKWEYLQDLGFVYYWWLEDYRTAAHWFQRASEVPNAPWWLKALAGTTIAQGGDRQSSRLLWEQIRSTADDQWLRESAERRLAQLQALDEIDVLTGIARKYEQRAGGFPAQWPPLVQGRWVLNTPVDPSGTEYVLDPIGRRVTVSETSRLFPLPPGR